MLFSKLRRVALSAVLWAAVAVAFAPWGAAFSASVLQMGGEPPFDADAPLFEIFFIDLVRDDGFLLRVNGQTLLIDGGYEERFPLLKNFLLKENGSLAVDAILNTHQHADHVAGEIALLKRGGGVKRFFGPLPTDTGDEYYQTLLPLLAKKGAEYVQLASGDVMILGGGRPGEPPMLAEEDFAVVPEDSALIRVYRCEETPQDINSTCLMLHVTYGSRTLFLLADAVGRPQTYLLETVDPADLRADVLKAAHHGLSPTVQPFLDAVSPVLGVITNVPRATEDQSRQFRLRNIPALYTGEGTIYLATDGQTWHVRQDSPF